MEHFAVHFVERDLLWVGCDEFLGMLMVVVVDRVSLTDRMDK